MTRRRKTPTSLVKGEDGNKYTFGFHPSKIARNGHCAVFVRAGITITHHTMQGLTMNDLLSVGDIANEAGVQTHRIRHIIQSRGIDAAATVAGRMRLFDRASADRIKSEINRIRRDRGELVLSV